MLRSLGLSLVLAVVGCSSGEKVSDKAADEATDQNAAVAGSQSIAEGWKAFCAVSAKLDPRRVAPSERMAALSKSVIASVSNAEVLAVFDKLGSAASTERGPILRRALTDAKVERCHLADYLARELHEQSCRLAGAAKDCLAAAKIYRTASLFEGEQQLGDELLELGCRHGGARACRELAGEATDPSNAWLGAACRRGDDQACRIFKGPVVSEFKLEPQGQGPVQDKLRATYSASIEDCVASSGEATSGDSGTFTVELELQAGKVVRVKVPTHNTQMAECIARSAMGWVLGAAADGVYEMKASFGSAKPAAESEAAGVASSERPQVEVVQEEDIVTHIAVLYGDSGEDGPGLSGQMTGGSLDDSIASDLDRELDGARKNSTAPSKRIRPRVAAKKSRLRFGGATVDRNSTLTGRAILHKARSVYAAGLKRCHRRTLKAQAGVAGRLKAIFTITERGKTTKVLVKGFNSTVSDCVQKQISRWRFPRLKDESGDPVSVGASLTVYFKVE